MTGGWINVGVGLTAAAAASPSSLLWLTMSSSSSSSSSGGGGGSSQSSSPIISSSNPFMYRKSTLIPWSSTTTTTTTKKKKKKNGGGGGDRGGGEPQDIISLGTCIEQQRQVLPSETEGDDDRGNEDPIRSVLRCTVQIHDTEDENNDEALYVDLPEGSDGGVGGGGLASQLWPSALASAIILSSPEFCSYVNDEHEDGDEDEDGGGDDDDGDDEDDPTLSNDPKPRIGRSTKRRKTIVELGSGRGLAGLIASKVGADCILTDNDEEAVELLQDAVAMLNNNEDSLLVLQEDEEEKESKTTASVKCMDWRDDEFEIDDDRLTIPVDIVFGSDIAYYWYLLRPIMDTTMKLFGKRIEEEGDGDGDDGSDEDEDARKNRNNSRGGGVFMVVGQANRESQWDLYKNIRDGCYNQLTDKNEPSWEGSTNMILYNLQMSEFCESLEDCDKCVDGTVPIAVLIHQNPYDDDDDTQHQPPSPFLPFGSSYAHIATDENDENILKSF